MATLRVTAAELERDVHALLVKVQQGTEVIVQEAGRDVVGLKPAGPVVGRMISDVIADLKAREAQMVIDKDFSDDIEKGIMAHREPWNPKSWD